jgi:hypothetical protein
MSRGSTGGGAGGSRRLVAGAGEHREEEEQGEHREEQGELSARSSEQGEHWKEEEQGELDACGRRRGITRRSASHRVSVIARHLFPDVASSAQIQGGRQSSKIQEPILRVAPGRKQVKIC